MNTDHLSLIKEIFARAEKKNIPLWLDGGWAIDFRLGAVTRDHEDIDIIFPEDKKEAYKKILKDLGFVEKEEVSYGFIMNKDGVELDSEACRHQDGVYIVVGYPDNSCPQEKGGNLNETHVRCVGWEKMFFEQLWLEKEVPKTNWKQKHLDNQRILESKIPPERQSQLRKSFGI